MRFNKATSVRRILAVLLLACIFFVYMCAGNATYTVAAGESEEWTRPSCGQTGNARKFCRSCGKKKPEESTPTPTPIPVHVGDYITFGHYPQTASGTDNTPIEWLVLDVQGSKALLLSRYGLDVQPYNQEVVDITWEKCSLRAWLNSTFMNKAFTTQEQAGIVLTSVDNSSSQGYSRWNTNGGNNTHDKIFLLSCTEANRYLGVTWEDSSNMKSRVSATAYAIKQGAFTLYDKTMEGSAAGWWWLRSPGIFQEFAAYVYTDGFIYSNDVDIGNAVVRPALWINLESGAF